MNSPENNSRPDRFLRAVATLFVLSMLTIMYGCQGSIASQVIANSYKTEPRNYKSAGFNNVSEMDDYVKNYEYLALKMSTEDWDSFYKRFPEYWTAVQNSKSYTFMNDYNSGYTAYAFRWNMMKREKTWDIKTVERLRLKKLESGDDIYKIIYSEGIPQRLIWNNDFDILAYDNGDTISLKENTCFIKAECKECLKKVTDYNINTNGVSRNGAARYEISDDNVAKIFGITRSEY